MASPDDERRPGAGAALVPAVLAVGVLVVLAAATASSWGMTDRFGVFGGAPEFEPRSVPPIPTGSPGSPPPLQDSGAGDLVLPLLWAGLVLGVLAAAYWVWRVLPRPPAKSRATAATGGLVAGDGGPDAPAVQQGVREAQELLDTVVDPTDAVLAAWVALEDAAARSGVPRRPADTPTELTSRVLAATEADADAVTTLLGLYHRARFSAAGVGPAAVAEARRCLGVLSASWSRFSATDAGPPP
ncbi:DUF4129 domain-containing protein [Friedmanniella luteola]|uniref:DUF4129 domain-containing protein n=1 Tax=Friedmanniella luteola TaxID=546871 RepID=UPI0012FE6242|nr:DUF4129 domain-containing protein [Friedmanniella luteola]